MYSINKKKNILITGAAGFIGSNLVKYMLKLEKFNILGLDNFDNFYSREQKMANLNSIIFNENFTLLEDDICNVDSINEIKNIDTIIHLAGKAGVRPSILNPLIYQDVNVRGTQILLEYARNNNIKQFIFASSSSVYGINNSFPWREDENLLPISPYASTKLSGEMLGHVYSQLYGIRFIALRFFTVYGPSQRPDLAIHKFFKCILNGEPINVYGDGTTSRDYTYIDDIIKGIVASIDYCASEFEVINLGNNNLVELTTLIESIEKICQTKAIINKMPEQLGDVKKTCADISKAKKLLNYSPSTDIKTGLENFLTWYQSYTNK